MESAYIVSITALRIAEDGRPTKRAKAHAAMIERKIPKAFRLKTSKKMLKIMPMCRPESASTWLAPEREYASRVALLIAMASKTKQFYKPWC